MVVEDDGPPPADGDLAFNPPIETGLKVTLDAGETGTGQIMLTNTGDSVLEYVFTQYHDDSARGYANPASPLAHLRHLFPATSEKGVDPQTPTHIPVRGEGGPDDFGYTWIDSNEPGGPSFEAIDISGTGTAVTLQDTPGCTFAAADEGTVAIELPFAFSFYGEPVTTLWANANGFLATQPVQGCAFTTRPFPDPANPTTASPGGMIAPLWADLHAYTAGQIYTEQLPDGRFVIQYNNFSRFAQETTSNLTFQAILSPGGAIKYQFLDVTGTFTTSTQIGIQSQDTQTGLQVASGAGYAQAGLAVLISAAPTFVTGVSPSAGSLAPGASETVTVAFDATDLLDGTYEGTLTIETNEENGSYDYPVTLNVVGEAGCVISPDPIAFGGVIIGFDETMTATVTNEGTASCTLTGATTDEDDFTVDFDGDVTLAPGQSTSFEVTFAPSSEGAISGTLTMTTDNGNVTAALQGTGQAPPEASVDPDALVFVMEPDSEASQSVTLSNLAGPGAADLEYSVTVAAARPQATGQGEPVAVDLEARRQAIARGLANAEATSAIRHFVPTTALPGVAYRGGEVVLSHSQSMTIVNDPSPIGCANWTQGFARENSYWRVFDLEAFDIDGVFTVNAVDVGVWMGNTIGAPTTVRLYTLDGAMNPANLTLVAQTDLQITSADHLGLATAEFDGAAFEAGDTMVVEWFISDGIDSGHHVLGGQNAAGETGPSYISSASCEIPNPVTMGSIGFPDAHWVMQVRGAAGPGTISVDPASGSIAPGDSEELVVTVNTEGMEEGTYNYELLIQTNDPDNPVLFVEVTVVVGEVSSDDGATPIVFDLKQNYPNPFANTTTIEYQLPQAEQVTITVFDLTGRRVATLVDDHVEAGTHSVVWQANGLASGVYLYRIQAGSFSKTLRTAVVN
jgi:uncharacterized cupredoxin-like copper-binding protein